MSRPSDFDDGSGAPAPVQSPELGITGWFRWFWRQLTSMRVALILLLLLASLNLFAEVINFDDLSLYPVAPLPSNYGGVVWSGLERACAALETPRYVSACREAAGLERAGG